MNEDSRPNILYILADDLGWALRYGASAPTQDGGNALRCLRVASQLLGGTR